MFFITEEIIPFNSLKEALSASPEWKIISIHGSEGVFKYPAERVCSQININFSCSEIQAQLVFLTFNALDFQNVAELMSPTAFEFSTAAEVEND